MKIYTIHRRGWYDQQSWGPAFSEREKAEAYVARYSIEVATGVEAAKQRGLNQIRIETLEVDDEGQDNIHPVWEQTYWPPIEIPAHSRRPGKLIGTGKHPW